MTDEQKLLVDSNREIFDEKELFDENMMSTRKVYKKMKKVEMDGLEPEIIRNQAMF